MVHVLFLSFDLQDYLVLLPSAYYEAPILQMRVTEPCSYAADADRSQRYTLGLERFEYFDDLIASVKILRIEA